MCHGETKHCIIAHTQPYTAAVAEGGSRPSFLYSSAVDGALERGRSGRAVEGRGTACAAGCLILSSAMAILE